MTTVLDIPNEVWTLLLPYVAYPDAVNLLVAFDPNTPQYTGSEERRLLYVSISGPLRDSIVEWLRNVDWVPERWVYQSIAGGHLSPDRRVLCSKLLHEATGFCLRRSGLLAMVLIRDWFTGFESEYTNASQLTIQYIDVTSVFATWRRPLGVALFDLAIKDLVHPGKFAIIVESYLDSDKYGEDIPAVLSHIIFGWMHGEHIESLKAFFMECAGTPAFETIHRVFPFYANSYVRAGCSMYHWNLLDDAYVEAFAGSYPEHTPDSFVDRLDIDYGKYQRLPTHMLCLAFPKTSAFALMHKGYMSPFWNAYQFHGVFADRLSASSKESLKRFYSMTGVLLRSRLRDKYNQIVETGTVPRVIIPQKVFTVFKVMRVLSADELVQPPAWFDCYTILTTPTVFNAFFQPKDGRDDGSGNARSLAEMLWRATRSSEPIRERFAHCVVEMIQGRIARNTLSTIRTVLSAVAQLAGRDTFKMIRAIAVRKGILEDLVRLPASFYSCNEGTYGENLSREEMLVQEGWTDCDDDRNRRHKFTVERAYEFLGTVFNKTGLVSRGYHHSRVMHQLCIAKRAFHTVLSAEKRMPWDLFMGFCSTVHLYLGDDGLSDAFTTFLTPETVRTFCTTAVEYTDDFSYPGGYADKAHIAFALMRMYGLSAFGLGEPCATMARLAANLESRCIGNDMTAKCMSSSDAIAAFAQAFESAGFPDGSEAVASNRQSLAGCEWLRANPSQPQLDCFFNEAMASWFSCRRIAQPFFLESKGKYKAVEDVVCRDSGLADLVGMSPLYRTKESIVENAMCVEIARALYPQYFPQSEQDVFDQVVTDRRIASLTDLVQDPSIPYYTIRSRGKERAVCILDSMIFPDITRFEAASRVICTPDVYGVFTNPSFREFIDIGMVREKHFVNSIAEEVDICSSSMPTVCEENADFGLTRSKSLYIPTVQRFTCCTCDLCMRAFIGEVEVYLSDGAQREQRMWTFINKRSHFWGLAAAHRDMFEVDDVRSDFSAFEDFIREVNDPCMEPVPEIMTEYSKQIIIRTLNKRSVCTTQILTHPQRVLNLLGSFKDLNMYALSKLAMNVSGDDADENAKTMFALLQEEARTRSDAASFLSGRNSADRIAP